MKRLALTLLPCLAAWLAGCASIRPGDQAVALPEAVALWYPAGYENHLILAPADCPPGSLAEFQLATGQGGRMALRAFAAQFPGAEEEIVAYHQGWAEVFQRDVWPVLRAHRDDPRVLQTLVAYRAPDQAAGHARASLGHLHRALLATRDPVVRERIQNLLAIHEVQQLRAQAIHQAGETPPHHPGDRLARVLQEAPLPPRFQLWLERQTAAERRLGDLAAQDWRKVHADGSIPPDIHLAETLVLADPGNRGLAENWQRQWPTIAAGPPLGQTFSRWQSAGGKNDPPVVWFLTRLVPAPGTSFRGSVCLRGVRGSVWVYLDGLFLGEHDAAGTGLVSCRLPLSFGNAADSQPRSLVLRVERPAGQLGTPALWHQPWLETD